MELNSSQLSDTSRIHSVGSKSSTVLKTKKILDFRGVQEQRVLDDQQILDIANLLRRDVLEMTTAAGSGHATSCLSCAEIISSVFFDSMHFEVSNPNNPDNDEFILSKGHAAPILYAALKRAGCIKEDLLKLRKSSSPLEGHPMPRSLAWVKVATGSLGQGLSVANGMALSSHLQQSSSKTYVLMGDSELAEGQVYEALQFAGHMQIPLIAIADINRLGQRGPTMLEHDLNTYQERFASFGFETYLVNGHGPAALSFALQKARASSKPSIILAKTFKGHGVSFLENKEGWHGKALCVPELHQALSEIPSQVMPSFSIPLPAPTSRSWKKIKPLFPAYVFGQEVATRKAYGNALAALAKSDSRILAIDAEVSNSTYAEEVKKATPQQFIEMFIAEQNMISVALGLSKKGHKVFASSFAAFLSRAADQLRMATISSANLVVCGSHAGVSIGEDGASQMALEDISMFRSLPGSTVLYPSDAASTQELVKLASQNTGITYIRTSRPKTPVIYPINEKFPIGDFKVVRQSKKDSLVLIGAGVTLHESLKAYEELARKNIHAAVIDLYCIKPLNAKKLALFIAKHGQKVVITEDHHPEGGLGEAVLSALINTPVTFRHLAVRGIPHSATAQELLDKHGISAKHIVSAAKKMI